MQNSEDLSPIFNPKGSCYANDFVYLKFLSHRGMWCATPSKTFNTDDDGNYYRYVPKSLLKAIVNGWFESMMVTRSHSLHYNGKATNS